jgi:DNA-binding transcriptional MerR regulator
VADTGSVITAFSESQVERLTGLTVRQLRYWDRTGFFVPAYAEEDRRLPYSRIYSFKDVVALRVLHSLRMQFQVSLQHLRQVAQKLGNLADNRWAHTTLYVLNRRVVFAEPETEQLREVVSGQYVVGIVLQSVISDTEQRIAQLRHRGADQIGRLERSRYVNRNTWVVAGTRIPTSAIWRFREAGYTDEQIIKEYPDLTPRDIEAAVAHERNAGVAAA